MGIAARVAFTIGLTMLAGAEGRAGTATRAPFGTAADGVVEAITLRNSHGMTVSFLTRSGKIIDIEAPDRKGVMANLVLSQRDFAAWDGSGSFNSIVGRFANRIDKGGFTLDGQTYALPGSNPKTGVSIHGGPNNGFSGKLWTAKLFERAGASGATLSLVSPDGENGYPGELSVDVTYTLTDANVLRLDYHATTTKPTVINLTNHAYFNIGGAASGPVYDQVLQVFASHYTPTDDRSIPTGEIAPVAGTPFDLRKPRPSGELIYAANPQIVMARGLDHNFVLDKPAGVALPVAIRLHDPRSGRQMEVRTTEPGVQIYSSNGFNGSTIGANGRPLRQSDALAFETQHYPDSPNKPNFPTTVLRPGENFRSTTEFAFSTDAKPFK